MLPSTLQDTTNTKPQLFYSVPDWEIKKKKKSTFQGVSLSRPPNPSIYAISLSQPQTQQLNSMIPVQAICYLRIVSYCQLPSAKAVGDFSRLQPPQIILHSLGFCEPKALQDSDNHIKKGNEEKGHKESNEKCQISIGYLISDFSGWDNKFVDFNFRLHGLNIYIFNYPKYCTWAITIARTFPPLPPWYIDTHYPRLSHSPGTL